LTLIVTASSASATGSSSVGIESEAHVGTKHHLLVSVATGSVDTLELVLGRVAVYGKFLVPTFEHDALVVVIVENSTLLSSSPESIVPRVGNGRTSESMCSRNSGSHLPSSVSHGTVNIVDEDF
jgi:hypothetical protein